MPADAVNFNASLLKKIPAGYELTVTGDIDCKNDTINVKVRKKAAEEVTTTLNVDFVTKDGEKLYSGYELTVTGDIDCKNDTINVKVRKKAAEEVTTTLNVDFVTKDGEKLYSKVFTITGQGSSDDDCVFTVGKEIELPENYKLAEGEKTQHGIPYGASTSVTIVVERADAVNEKTVYVSYIDAETKQPLENAIEEIKLAADANSFNTSILKKVPAGYEVCVTGDITFEGDTVNVEVSKSVAEEKTVYVSYIDAETKQPLENAIEEIKLAADANSFNTSILKEVPAGYEVCETGDVTFEGDTVNVEVRKAEKTVYVS